MGDTGTARLIIKNGTIVTLESPNRVLTDRDLLIEEDRITAIGSFKHVNARVIDARGKVVMPGFINAHTHFYSTFARGLMKAEPSKNFPEILRNLWWRLDRSLTPEDCYYSTLVAGIDAIRHGTTTIFDHNSSPHAVKGSLDGIAAAVTELGLRACLCYEVSDRDGEKIAQESIEENVRFLEACRKKGGDQLRALFGLHASFTLKEKTLRRCVESARALQPGFHIHCAEDVSDQKITRERFGKSVVRRLHDCGVLGPRTICAHAVHLDDREWDLLARTRTAVVHNPQSNLNNAVGVMDLARGLRKRALVGLGTDAMTVNMLEELRSAIWAQRLWRRDPSASFGDAVDLLVRNNQKIARRYFDKIGQLREGWNADLILVDYNPPTPMNPGNFAGHLVFGISQAAVDTMIVGGKVLMRGKKLCLLDEDKITWKSRTLASALWRRF